MNRRAVLKFFAGLVSVALLGTRAEAKAKAEDSEGPPDDIAGTYRGRFGDCTMVVKVRQSGKKISYSYRFRGKKHRFQGTGSAVASGSSFSGKGASAKVVGRKLHLSLPKGRKVVLKR